MWIKVQNQFLYTIRIDYKLIQPHNFLYFWIQGGNAIWGNHTHAPDDLDNCTTSHGTFLSFRPSELLGANANEEGNANISMPSDTKNLTAEDAGTWILEHTPVAFQVGGSATLCFQFLRNLKLISYRK